MTIENQSLYPSLLGPEYDLLPEKIQSMHRVNGNHRARGRGRVSRGPNPLANLVATVLRMPRSAEDIPVIVTFSGDKNGETIFRNFDGTTVVTRQFPATGPETGLLWEKFGPTSMLLELLADAEGITFQIQNSRFLGLPLPRIFWPAVTARERVQDDQFHYFVNISLPVLGQLIEYEGCLTLDSPNQE